MEIEVIENSVLATFKSDLNTKLSEGWSVVFASFNKVGSNYIVMIERKINA
jgi:hypothetical protein